MISTDDARRIANGWVREYSIDPYVAKADRDRTYFFKLDDLIYRCPADALVVFEQLASQALNDWVFEGVSGGPIRTFLQLYGNGYDADMDAIGSRVSPFGALRDLAIQGL